MIAFIFNLKTRIESQWTDPAFVGQPIIPTYKGRPVILDDFTLDAFQTYMEGQIFNFNYDHAIGLFELEISNYIKI